MDFNQFKEKINHKFNINLNGYKERQLKRRIDSLMHYQGYSDYASYFSTLENDPERWAQFMDKVTINVSEFFRNPDIFKTLEEKIIPYLIEQYGSLKIWSAACSNGAEPYSTAMLLKELSGGRHTIHATDMDDKILALAKQGCYPANIIKNVSDTRKRKYFEEKNGQYQLNNSARDLVSFRKHDLLTGRYEGGYHLIVCRNVTIYFTREAQMELYSKFNKSLAQGGILFIGATENIINYHELGFEKYLPWFYRKVK